MPGCIGEVVANWREIEHAWIVIGQHHLQLFDIASRPCWSAAVAISQQPGQHWVPKKAGGKSGLVSPTIRSRSSLTSPDADKAARHGDRVGAKFCIG
jgi:hypothetical protein